MVKTDKKYQDYLLKLVVNTFYLQTTNTEKVQSYINALKNNT